MTKLLSAEQISHYREQGWLSPIDVLSRAEVADARAKLEAFEASKGAPIAAPERVRSFLLFPWVDDIMRHEAVLDAVEDLIGPDILCWSSVFWVKEARSESFVSWHQDLTYWGLDNDATVSVWVALSDASEAAGCMSVIPGSHREIFEHAETYAENNLLTRGQELTIDVGARETAAMPLCAGQASIHNGRSAHGSGPNQTDDRRIGISFQYMPPSTKQMLNEWDSAALVRGTDSYGHFELAPRPTREFDPVGVEFHEQSTQAMRDILYKGAQQASEPTV